jgi:hypothetical protein
VNWYLVTTESNHDKTRMVKDFKRERLFVRSNADSSDVIIGIGSKHQKFIQDYCKEVGVQYKELEKPPTGLPMLPRSEGYKCVCSEEFFYDPTDFARHQRLCAEYRKTAASKKKADDAKAYNRGRALAGETDNGRDVGRDVGRDIGKETGKDASRETVSLDDITPILNSLENTRDQLWAKVEYIDAVISGLKAWRNGSEEAQRLMRDADTAITAVREILKNGGYGTDL